MHILSAEAPTNPFTPLWPALLLAIGAAAAAATGVFRRGSIVGPDRIDPAEPLEPLTVAIGGGLFVYFAGSLLLMSRLRAAHPALATQPADQPLSDTDVMIDLLARTVAFAVITLMLLLWYRRPRRIGLSPLRLPGGLAKGLLSLLIVIPLMTLVIFLTDLALRPDSQYVHPYLNLLGESHDLRGRLMILLSILVAAPLTEELFFRGCIQTFLVGLLSRSKSWPPARTRWLAVILTSLLFASAHPDWWSRPPIFVLSLCLGYSYERTGNLWTAITIHASFNAAETLLFIHS
jgi:membrane protease YdiL (CAAX protease family)